MSSNGLVQRLWNYCNVLRDDGLSYGDYVEQLTYLLFLKMADEQTKPPFGRPAFVPAGRPPTLPPNVVDRIRLEHARGQSLGDIARTLNADGLEFGSTIAFTPYRQAPS